MAQTAEMRAHGAEMKQQIELQMESFKLEQPKFDSSELQKQMDELKHQMDHFKLEGPKLDSPQMKKQMQELQNLLKQSGSTPIA